MRYKVLPNKTIQSPDGARFIARGIQMFDYLLCSFEPNRINYNYRRFYEPEGTGPACRVSEPTYYARLQYIDNENVVNQLTCAKEMGANIIRVNIEPAIRYATVSYTDPTDGLTYPSDLSMLDEIIAAANSLNMVVQLQNANDSGSVSENTTFLEWLADRYKDNSYVWINPANELYGFANNGANVLNVQMWEAAQQSYVSAIRGAGFKNPICLDPPGWAERLDLVVSVLNTNATFKNDDNLIIQPHYYPAQGQNDFRADKLPAVNSMWFQYVNQFCLLVGEVGIDNLPGRLDPNLDGTPSVNLTDWGNAQAAVTDFLKWANEQCLFTAFNGCIGHMWKAHSRVSGMSDDNSMHNINGSRSTWGTIYRNNFLSPPVFNVSQLMMNMPALQGPKMSHASLGSPDFQCEGKVNTRAAAMFITPNGASPIAGFVRRDNGWMIGSITGNGSGVVYGTTSDYRIKEDVSAITEAEILAFIDRINPVNATWKDSGIREPVFIAHEIQELLPSSVHGDKDGEGFQTVDYAKSMPMVWAALRYLIKNKQAA
jgi:hypothetical protein